MKYFILLFFYFLSLNSYGVIHGMDNRSEADLQDIMDANPGFSLEKAEMLMGLQKASAKMVAKKFQVDKDNWMDLVVQLSDGTYSTSITLNTLGEEEGLCPDLNQKFSDQYVLPGCSGFLVAPDLMVTAGHCLKGVDSERLKDIIWIFGYGKQYSKDPKPIFQPNQVYSVKEIVSWSLDHEKKLDFALLQLDRKVEGVTPLRIRRIGNIEKGEPLAIIGYPSGLTTKLAANAIVLDNSNPNFFNTNLDIINQNSGSPVINLNTGLVEGILVRTRYKYDYYPRSFTDEKICNRLTIQGETEGGEEVSSISQVAGLIP